MNPFPQDRSIIILNNCSIHRSNIVREIIELHGILLVFLPPYSPDLNPIEESFSFCESLSVIVMSNYSHSGTVKACIRRHWPRLARHEHPEVQLQEATYSVTADVAPGWFRHSGYNM
jgi:transposase